MSNPDRNNGQDTDAPSRARAREGRSGAGKFTKGNPGRPPGSRNKTTLAVEALIEGEAKALTRKAIELAKAGDMAALRLCMDRIAAPKKDRPSPFELPPMKDGRDHPVAIAAIISAVAAGDLTAGEAEALCRMFEQHRKSIETAEILDRLEKLEGKA